MDPMKPRSADGTIWALIPTIEGGAEVAVWRDGGWVSLDRPASYVLGLPGATAAELARAGVSTLAAPEPGSSRALYPTLSEYEDVWDRHLRDGLRKVLEERRLRSTIA
jgi:hypothetical protein